MVRSFQSVGPVAALCIGILCSSLTLQAEPPRPGEAKSELRPTLGTLGNLLVEQSFDNDAALESLHRNTGTLRINEGHLEVFEKASDRHAAAFRRLVPLQDCAVQVEFAFAEHTKMIHLGFDPAAGELKKKGHLFSVVVTPSNWTILEHLDKNDPASKNKNLATAKKTLEPGKRVTLLLECKGDRVTAQLSDREPLKAESGDFHVKKPGLVFRAAGPDDEAVRFDNLKVWELK